MSEGIETQKKSNGALIGIIVLLLIASATMAYLWSSKNKALNECNNANTALQADMEGMNQMMSGYVGNMTNDLKKDFQNMLATYDALIEKDASKADSLNVQRTRIQELIAELNSNKKRSASQLYAMRKENETLRGIMKGYVKQIDSLNTLNLKLSSDLDVKTTELKSTINERDQFKTEAEKSAEQVKKGSKLQAYGFSSVGLRMKLNNTTEVTNKARNCIQMKSSFTISENPIATPGLKKVYMQIISPDGKTLQSRSSNTVQTDGGTIAFSDMKEIDYKNERIDVAIFYNLQEDKAIKGTYKVRIYCEGQLIGTDAFTLK
jgi:flagellar biosynthesis GTPase FlhF